MVVLHNIWANFHPFHAKSNISDIWDFLVNNNLLPLASLVVVLFCCSKRYGWGRKKFLKEANTGKGPKIQNWMRPVFIYVVPVIIAFLYVCGMVTFKWR